MRPSQFVCLKDFIGNHFLKILKNVKKVLTLVACIDIVASMLKERCFKNDN